MRKTNLLILTSVILLSSLSLTAQDDKRKGLRAGWQTSNYFIEGSKVGTSNLNAFYFGYFHDTKIIPLLHFVSGIDYMQNGYSSTDGTLNMEFKYTNHVLSVPLLLELKLGPVLVMGGTGLNFTVAQNYKLDGISGDVPEAIKTNFFDMPLVAGLGVKIAIITIEARYHWGIFDASKSDLTTMQSQYFQIGAGISF